MRCRFVKEIFHNKDNGFCIFVYHTEDGSVPEAARDARYKGKGSGSRRQAPACRRRTRRKPTFRENG